MEEKRRPRRSVRRRATECNVSCLRGFPMRPQILTGSGPCGGRAEGARVAVNGAGVPRPRLLLLPGSRAAEDSGTKGPFNDAAGRASCPGRWPRGPHRPASTRSGRARRGGWRCRSCRGGPGFSTLSPRAFCLRSCAWLYKVPRDNWMVQVFLSKLAPVRSARRPGRSEPSAGHARASRRAGVPRTYAVCGSGAEAVHEAEPPVQTAPTAGRGPGAGAGRPVGRRPLHGRSGHRVRVPRVSRGQPQPPRWGPWQHWWACVPTGRRDPGVCPPALTASPPGSGDSAVPGLPRGPALRRQSSGVDGGDGCTF